MLDRLVIYDGLNCYDSCIMTYLHHIGKQENLVYNHMWEEMDLEFDETYKSYSSRVFEKNLYQYFGLQIEQKVLDADEIIEMLMSNQIVMVKTDLIKYPFSPSYQHRSAPHFFLIYDYEEKDKKVLFSDPSRNHLNQNMDLDVLFSIQEGFYVFSQKSVKMTDFSYEKDLVDSCIEMKNRTMESIGRWTDYQSMSVEEYAKKHQLAGLYFTRLISNRACYVHFIEEVYRKNSAVFSYAEEFTKITQGYNSIKNMFYKLLFQKKISEQSYDAIRERYEMELENEKRIARVLMEEMQDIMNKGVYNAD